MDERAIEILHADLQRFNGSDTWYQHQLVGWVVYSEGVQYLAEAAGAYWLIDAIASHIGHNKKIRAAYRTVPGFASLHFWKLRKVKDGAVLEAVLDLGQKPVARQRIEYTDFPFPASGEFTIYAGMDAGILVKLYLPSER